MFRALSPGVVGGVNEADAALLELLRLLGQRGYRFVTPTPASHARVVGRTEREQARDVTCMLGWSLAFRASLDPEVEALLHAAGAVERCDDRWRATVRVSSLHDRLFLHSAYPTEAEDTVFFGPDSYRFADLIRAELVADPLEAGARVVDIGTGSGVGGIVAALATESARVTMTDINPAALRFARINATAAGITPTLVEGADLSGVADAIDLATANPPYIVDDSERAYRHGGGMHGCQVALDMARMAVERLAPGGRLILYTGSAIVDGDDPLHAALATLASESGSTLRYRELDPDVFGEELSGPAYADVDRIALVAAVVTQAA